MKKLLLILSLMMIGLSGCYVRGHDEGYRRDRGHEGDQRGDRDRGGEHDGDRYRDGEHGEHH